MVRRAPSRPHARPGSRAVAAAGLILCLVGFGSGRARAEVAAVPEPVNSVRIEAGLGGPGGFGAVRFVRRHGPLTLEPGLGLGATGAGAGLLVGLALRQPGPPAGLAGRPRAGVRAYVGGSVAINPRDPARTIDLPRGTFAWADLGAYLHARVGARAQLVVGFNVGVVVAAPDRSGIGEGDDDFDTIGLFGSASWWVKQGVAPGVWAGVQL